MKECKTCKNNKPFTEYKLHTNGNLRGVCNPCKLEKLRAKNYPVSVEFQSCANCKQSKSYTEFHKCKTFSSGLFKVCKVCRSLETKESYKRRSSKVKKSALDYYHENKPKVMASRKVRAKERLKEDPFHRVKRNLRNRLYYALKNTEWKKNSHFREYIGCDRDTLIAHLEAQFQPGMTWENYGEWQIDHVIPLASAENEEGLYKLCHYQNLQPLWEAENKAKGDKIDYKAA